MARNRTNTESEKEDKGARYKKQLEKKSTGGRPVKQVDPDTVFQLSRRGVPKAIISRILGISEETLDRNFTDAIEEGKATGCSGLMSKSFDMAMDGNTTMLQQELKRRCGYKDRYDEDLQAIHQTFYLKEVDDI